MKTTIGKTAVMVLLYAPFLAGCGSNAEQQTAVVSEETQAPAAGQSAVQDDVSQKDIVKVAVGSKDHSTLVQAVQAANYVDVLANAGPFTVFAPVNDAFAQLPAGTVEGLLKPEKQADLRNILEYHVYVGVLKPEDLTDGRVLNMVNLANAEIKVEDGKPTINGAHIVASVPASNGIIHVIDKVLLPPAPTASH
jgi:uncharacterized surface protein with fasciclin (FAS1) repeats